MGKKRVLLGMSGGVDSSVAARVLQEDGYEVVGVTFKLWDGDNDLGKDSKCCSLDDVEDARKVAISMGIDHYVLNLKDVFKKNVVNYFIREYLEGKTPNPCIACNRYIKFSAMFDKAKMLECDYISTGHYARVEYRKDKGLYLLKRAKDLKKDQSYVLYNLNQETLPRVLFPLGEMTKDEVRDKARVMGLLVSDKPDSQDICFVDDNYVDFIKKYSGHKPEAGDIVKTNGEIVGRHDGIINYTVGQRKGLGVYLGKKIYVKEINAKENKVVIGEDEELKTFELKSNDVNLIANGIIENGAKIKAKIRYNAGLEEAILYFEEDGCVAIRFERAQRAVTPGQAVVFYDEEGVVLGGGKIC